MHCFHHNQDHFRKSNQAIDNELPVLCKDPPFLKTDSPFDERKTIIGLVIISVDQLLQKADKKEMVLS
jgi:hypothetical protein